MQDNNAVSYPIQGIQFTEPTTVHEIDLSSLTPEEATQFMKELLAELSDEK